MVRRDESALVAYVAEYSGQAVLILDGSSDPAAATAALDRAAAAVRRIPHPDDPDMPLPNWCEVLVEDAAPVLHLDMQSRDDYAERVVTAILTELDAAGVDGRLTPRKIESPFDYDAQADIFHGRADFLDGLDERGLPPGFPAGFPVPEHCTLVIAQRIRDDTAEHAGWRRDVEESPFADYPERLRAFGCRLELLPDETKGRDPRGMIGYRIHHPAGAGSVWIYHEWPPHRRRHQPPRAWYVSVVWKPL